MKTLNEIVSDQHARREPLDDPLTDRLLTELVALAEEVCVLRDRIDTAARLSRAGEAVDDASIDAWDPPPDVVDERLARHRAYFEDLFARLGG